MSQMKSEFWLSHVVTYLKSVAIELDKKFTGRLLVLFTDAFFDSGEMDITMSRS